MTSTKRFQIGVLATHGQNRRDSGIYSESWQSEASEPLKRPDRGAEVDSRYGKGKPVSRIENERTIITSEIGEVASTTEKQLDEFSRPANLYVDIEEQERLLSSSEYDKVSDKNNCTCELFVNNGKQKDCLPDYNDKCEHSGYKLHKPRTDTRNIYCALENKCPCRAVPNNHTDIDVVNRCDALINKLQDVSQKYFKLERSYQNVKKLCYLMVIVNGVLLLCVITIVPLLFVLSRGSNERSRGENNDQRNAMSPDSEYQICFDCSDLNQGTSFSLETLTGVSQRDGSCCFRSIMSVIRSQSRNFLNTLEDMTKNVKKQISELNRRILQLEIGLAPNISKVISNVLQVMVPKQKTAVFLKSIKDMSLREAYDASNKFIKLRWSTTDAATILVGGNVNVTEGGLTIKVMSESYYFLYTKIKFRHKERATYKRVVPLRYLVYRKRGSISTYIYEAKLSCVFNDMSQEHTSTSELILHLNRDDEIFISIDDADKQFLSAETGSHSIGLFEI